MISATLSLKQMMQILPSFRERVQSRRYHKGRREKNWEGTKDETRPENEKSINALLLHVRSVI